MRLEIEKIETCGGTQTRVAISEDVVAEYAEAMTGGDEFPPVIVYHDGTTHYLADGFHRVMAAARIKLKEIDADVRKGTRTDALIYSLGANRTNGLQRTNKDKRQCVKIALEQFKDWTDRRIAEVCGVSDPFVGKVRSEVQTVSTSPTTNTPTVRIGRRGKKYRAKPQPKEETPQDETPAPTPPKPAKPLPPSSGMQYATMAINQLEKINQNDTQREQALTHVANWIANQLKG